MPLSLLQSRRRLFGTDGVRGVANTELSPELALALGRAAGLLLDDGPVVVGRDTRRSGEMLSLALQAGFHSAGIDTVDVGVLPTGGISFLTVDTGAAMGAVVSASHNPAADNGIKFLSRHGTKLSDEEESRIEDRVRNAESRAIPVGPAVGTRFPLDDAIARYVAHLAGISQYRLTGLRLLLDCANGAAYRAAPELFTRLGAEVDAVGVTPDGMNINDGCGATHPESLAGLVEGRIGLAFDGDADRLIAVDEEGGVVDGDAILAIVGRHWKRLDRLRKNVVVTTVMANLGLRQALEEDGIELVQTKVGDRYVLEEMRRRRAVLGGEQSGHVIFLDKGITGDGLLTAVRLLEVVAGTGKTLAELRRDSITTYPQVLHNVEVGRRVDLDQFDELWDAVRQAEAELGDRGRILVRASGTEPVVRVMVEAPSPEEAERYAVRLAEVVSATVGKEG